MNSFKLFLFLYTKWIHEFLFLGSVHQDPEAFRGDGVVHDNHVVQDLDPVSDVGLHDRVQDQPLSPHPCLSTGKKYKLMI